MLSVNLRYKRPTESDSIEFQVRVTASERVDQGSEDLRFASAVAAYGMLLRESKFRGQASWDSVVSTAEESIGRDRDGLRREFVGLAKIARRISESE